MKLGFQTPVIIVFVYEDGLYVSGTAVDLCHAKPPIWLSSMENAVLPVLIELRMKLQT